MGLISWLFRKGLTKEEMAGIMMDMRACWEVSGVEPGRAIEFFSALIELIPADSTFCIEGTNLVEEVRSFLQASRIPHLTRVQLATSYPKPDVFHIAFNEENMKQMAEFAENFTIPEICDHIYIYQNNEMLLEWNDAFSNPLYISKKIPEEYVKVFCQKLGCEYCDGSVPSWSEPGEDV
jgi:hypothetical protein